MASCCARGGSGWILGKISSQDGGAVTIPGGVQELWRCGTEGRGQWAWWGWVGGWTRWVGGLLLFSSLNDSMILELDSDIFRIF